MIGIKRIFILFLFISCFLALPGQERQNVETLDHFFAGVPLKKDFANWYHYVRNHPQLGIDSVGVRGFYSSFKPGIGNSFPFPDSLQVKLLLRKTIFYDSVTQKPFDSLSTILIEGVFSDDKAGRKGSRVLFADIRKKLRRHYKDEVMYAGGSGASFRDGKNSNFPVCSLWLGYERDKKFYYVIIGYDFPQRPENPPYLELAS